MAYLEDIETYRIFVSEMPEREIPTEAIRITDTKGEYIQYDQRHEIPEQDSLLTAMDLLMLMDNRDIINAFNALTGSRGLFEDGLTTRKIIVYGVIGVVALILLYAFFSPMMT